MKIDEIMKEVLDDNPVAIIIIKEDEDSYTSRIYGRIEPCQVQNIIFDMVEQMKQETFNDIKDQLPF